LWLFRFELVYHMALQVQIVQTKWLQTIVCHVSMKLMGAQVPWSWMPSPLGQFGLMSADLIEIEADHFTASGTCMNCIDLKPPKAPNQPWQVTCRPFTLKKGSFLGPLSVAQGGATLAEGAATMDCSFVPPDVEVQPWTTLMGNKLHGDLIVKRKRNEGETQAVLPYAASAFLVVLCIRMLLWMTSLPVFITGVFLMMYVNGSEVGSTMSLLEQVEATDFCSIDTICRIVFCIEAAALIRICALVCWMIFAKHLFLGSVHKDVKGPIRGLENLKWILSKFIGTEVALELRLMSHTPVFNFIARACGSKVGKNVQLSWKSFFIGAELDLYTFEDDCYAGGQCYGHNFGNCLMEYKEIKIERHAQLRDGGITLPGAILPSKVVTHGASVIIPNSLSAAEGGLYAVGHPAYNVRSAPADCGHML